ncbi:MAG TPA: ribose-phosphate diphosphokinase [Caulobacteraceae bacterium]|nr:ribose-phosphate diphosphokinase [Caulobacteraceae bacterium]
MTVLAFADEAAPAGRLAAALGAPLSLIDVHAFPDGEVLPTVSKSAHTVVLYRSLDRPNPKIMPLLLAADAVRRMGADRVELVCPYLCYLRQDVVFAHGQPLSRDVICGLLGRAFDRVVTVDAHLHRTSDLSAVMGIRADNLSAAAVLADALAGEPPVIVGPDRESRPWAWRVADRLGGDCLTFSKTRGGDRAVRLQAPDLSVVSGRRVVIVDDVASTAATLLAVVDALKDAGAASIEVAVVHALFDGEVDAALRAAGVTRIISTDSVTHPSNAAPLAGLLAEALMEGPP